MHRVSKRTPILQACFRGIMLCVKKHGCVSWLCKREHLLEACNPHIDISGLYCDYVPTWTKRIQLLRARVSDPHRLARLFSTESEYERKLHHVGRPFLGIFTEKNVENASSVKTHPNFAGVLPWHHVVCQKTWRRFMALLEGTPTSRM